MKTLKALRLTALLPLFGAASAFGTIIPITDTATSLSLGFEMKNTIPDTPETETYTSTAFPVVGDVFTFYFDDRLIKILFGPGNIEKLITPGTNDVFNQDTGALDFSGSYVKGGYTINYSVDSQITTTLGKDTWEGTFAATATPNGNGVPDAGSTSALLALALGGLAAARRKLGVV